MSLIADYGTLLLLLACLFGFFMAWGVGANDVANAMGTSVGSKALTIKQAIMIAMVFEFAGAYLAGGEVTETIKNGIVDAEAISPDLMVLGMMSALLAAGTWLLIATSRGWPVSTTHSIVGAVIGFAAVGVSMEAVQWSAVGPIVASWVVTPVLSGLVAFGLFMSVQKLIINTDDPFLNAKRFVPLYMFATGFMVALMTLTKGLKHIGLDLSTNQSLLLAVGVGVLVMVLGISLLSRIKVDVEADKEFHYASVEKVFAVLMVFTACAMAFAHGANDVANAVGPLAAIVGVIQSGGDMAIGAKSAVPGWVLLLGAIGIVVGLATYGYKVIATIGKEITELTPSRGFAAELATASTVVSASAIGLPVSTTHTLVGAVLGIGLARGIGALNLGVIGKIFMSWLITLPVGAGLSIVFFFILRGIFL
ncbi:MAG: inorganic phosphate transporter [Pseudomonadaceae bacterium]|uniref:inorganic phosphate transporter n=1 Tax=Pseudomonas sp. Ga0074129 TaxID=1752219 RepID=UPI000A5FDC13|nr:inorganic phosphate transporter [Pseudomonas sp. Ga0074129]MBX9763784.1 inorganic phosphate transporter [Pseudomonadaceae bacterium]